MEKLFVSGDYEEEPALSVPLLVVLLHAHNLFRRYIIGQINVTSQLVPALCYSIGMTENKSAFTLILFVSLFRIAIVLRVHAASIGVGVQGE